MRELLIGMNEYFLTSQAMSLPDTHLAGEGEEEEIKPHCLWA